DIASVAMNPAGMAAVFKLVPVSRLLYGSDAPFGSTTVIAAALSKFELAAAHITALRRQNALRLFQGFTARRPFPGGDFNDGDASVIIDWHSHIYTPEEAADDLGTVDGKHGPKWGERGCPMVLENFLEAHYENGIDISVVTNAAHYLRGKADHEELLA